MNKKPTKDEDKSASSGQKKTFSYDPRFYSPAINQQGEYVQPKRKQMSYDDVARTCIKK